MASYRLPDGRLLLVERTDEDAHWHLQLPATSEEIVGEPLQSTLAALLGFPVAHDDWPSWLGDFAAEIERSLWRHS
jgi:hypothetical protein